jgi:hypothetical protein
MTAATMSSNDLILPGEGYNAFIEFVYNTPSQPQLLRMNRSDIIATYRKTAPGSGPTTSHDNFDENEWDANYRVLKNFHAKHGNCSVPFGKETGSLRSWTERQKKLYASSKLGPDQVNDLKVLDFDFTIKNLSTRSVVPKPIKPSVVATAASTEKRDQSKNLDKETSAKKQKVEVKPSSPPAANTPKSSLVIDDEQTWNKQYEALAAYKAKHGNCSVPFGKETGPLRSWTERQKKLYASSKLGPDKADKMAELGFVF